MLETVRSLSAPEMKGRGLGTTELDQAAALIASRFEAAGLVPGGTDGSWYQEWEDRELKVRMKNVIGVLPGRNPLLAGQSVVVGAHYDHLGTKGAVTEHSGKVHPGADDNASGMAVLLELVHVMTLDPHPERSVVFAAFTGEEAGRRGSRHYVAQEKQYPVSKCIGMINLDTVGRLGKKPLIVIGAGSAQEWPRLFDETGGAAKVAIATNAGDLDSSDQVSFHEAGVPAVQLFTGPHLDYHRPTDSADKIDPRGLGKVATVALLATRDLADRTEPLTPTMGVSRKLETKPVQGRKVTLGIVPDFTYQEQGVRLGGTVPGGPAEAAGLRDGDIIIGVNGAAVASLKDLAEALTARNPGERITILFLRQGKELKAEPLLKER
jgi:membrane-associated protease RseP (regulator of RpoE activity)